MDEEAHQALAAATAKVNALIMEAAEATADCMQAEINGNMLAKPDGTLADSQASAIESRLNYAILSNRSPAAPFIRLGITVGEARQAEWRGIPDEVEANLWVWCRSVKAVVDRNNNVVKTGCIMINWELDQPQFMPF